MNIDDFIYAGQPENFVYVSLCAQVQLAAGLLEVTGAHHEDSDARAIDVTDAVKVENDLLFVFAHQVFRGPFQLLALAAHRDSARNLNYYDVGIHIPILKRQHMAKLLFACKIRARS
jgi:hypothetical protein